jgi:hypothetical protein
VPKSGDVWQPEVLSTVRDVTSPRSASRTSFAERRRSVAAPSVRHVEDRGGSIEADYLMRDVPQTPEEMAALALA